MANTCLSNYVRLSSTIPLLIEARYHFHPQKLKVYDLQILVVKYDYIKKVSMRLPTFIFKLDYLSHSFIRRQESKEISQTYV
ncbi:hypothetical protein J23TS9_19060 [Paenibacillus sp. J23TS9]|nr:hypothetical protein J23TS9_19060 [Paenibacillus sp. J23TS9]